VVERSDELAVLSREHHVMLELALVLRRASADDAAAVSLATLEFFSGEGLVHFRLEEDVLLPAFARHAGADDPDVMRVLAEHLDIRRRVGDLASGAGATDVLALNALGERLRDHVRYEERTLFGRIEATLQPGELAALGVALRAAGEQHQPPRA
jgi:hemerythrin-like domain-containing protein